MRLLGFSALLVMAAGCDDTEFNSSGGSSEYDASAVGAISLMHDHCIECHPTLIQSFSVPVLVSDIESGDGEFVVAGDAEASEFWLRMVEDSGRPIMPPTGALPPDQIEGIRTWINDGALLIGEEGGEE